MAPNQKINLKDKVEDGEMDLSMCDLQDVPIKEIAVYKKVYSLDISNNHLIQLPKTFSTLTNLTKLDLSKNKLKTLPDNFGNLIKLKHLDLYKNELQHLPISFSDLKSLRWLDLKDNPLVPAIKEEAGQCLDSRQCQSCAMNIVAFYSALKAKIDEERENREKQRQKDKLANELAAQKAKHQEKKIKKKEKAKQEEKAAAPVTQKVPEVNKTDKQAKTVKSSRSLFKCVFYLLVLFSLACTSLFVLTSVKYPHTQFIQENVVKYWSVYLQKAPPMVQDFGYKAGVFIGDLHNGLGKFIYEMQIQDNILHYMDRLKEYYNFVLYDKK